MADTGAPPVPATSTDEEPLSKNEQKKRAKAAQKAAQKAAKDAARGASGQKFVVVNLFNLMKYLWSFPGIAVVFFRIFPFHQQYAAFVFRDSKSKDAKSKDSNPKDDDASSTTSKESGGGGGGEQFSFPKAEEEVFRPFARKLLCSLIFGDS